MTDGVQLNPGTGGDLAYADDLGAAGKAQGVKLVTGANSVDGGYVTADNPLPVGALGYPVSISSSIVRPADTAIYAIGDNIANSTSAPTSGGFTFTGAARKSGGSGIILGATISSAAQNPATRLAGELWLFNAAVTNINDNAAFVLSDAEIKTCIGIIPFALFSAGANNLVCDIDCFKMFTCVGSANLRYLVRARNTYTPASAEELAIVLKVLQLD